MIDRLRLLADRPLDPVVARAVVTLATAVLLGFAAVFALGLGGGERSEVLGKTSPRALPAPSTQVDQAEPTPKARPVQGQDPQDEKGSAAGRRAADVLRSHRALQHVPYRDARLSIRLVGARGDRALLRVSAPTIDDARRGWRAFLRRFEDDGRAYVPLFGAEGAVRG